MPRRRACARRLLLLQYYDERATAAVDNWLLELPEDLHAAVRDAVGEAARQGKSWWNSVIEGTVDPGVLAGESEENLELVPRRKEAARRSSCSAAFPNWSTCVLETP